MGVIKRLLNKKTIYVTFITLFMCVLCYVVWCIGTTGVSTFVKNNKLYNETLNKIIDDDSAAEQYINELRKSGSKDMADDIQGYVSYIEGYEEYISNTVDNAVQTKEFSIFAKNNGYVIRNVDKICKDYSKLEQVKPRPVNTGSVDNYEKYIPVISGFVLIIICYMLFNMQKERDNGEILFTYSAAKGRFSLAVKRNIIITFTAFILTLIFNAVLYAVSVLLYGAADLSAPVQSISSYAKCSSVISIGGMLLINVLETGLGVSLIAVSANLVFNVLNNKYIAICLLGVVFFMEWRVSLTVQNNSVKRLLANINLYRITDYSVYHKNYQNINVFGYPVSSYILMFIIITVLYVVCFILSACAYAWHYPYTKEPFILSKVKIGFEQLSGYLTSRCGLIGMELYKLLIRGRKILLVVTFVIAELILINVTKVEFPSRQVQMDKVYEEYGGADWERFITYVNDYEISIQDTEDEIANIKSSVSDKEEAHNILMDAEKLSAEAQEKRKVLEEYRAVIARMERISNSDGIAIYAMSDRGYNEIYGVNSYIRECGIMIMLIVIVVILGAGYYMEERQSGVCRLMSCSKKGVYDIYRFKKRLILITTFIIAMIFILTDVLLLNKMYGYKYINAPLISLTFMENKVWTLVKGIKIWQYIIINIAAKMAVVLVTLHITLMCSRRFRSLFFVPVVILVMSAVGILVV